MNQSLIYILEERDVSKMVQHCLAFSIAPKRRIVCKCYSPRRRMIF